MARASSIKAKSVKLGDVVEVEFLDHVEGGGEPYRFKVWGVLALKSR